MQADRTDQLLIFHRGDGERHIAALKRFVVRGNPALRLSVRIRMRNEQRVERHLALAGQSLNGGSVLPGEAAQHESRRGNHGWGFYAAAERTSRTRSAISSRVVSKRSRRAASRSERRER